MTTILLVDDHELFRSRARALLEGAGYEVIGEAEDGVAALAAAARLHPDIVLLDVQLPDISGFAVADELGAGVDPPTVVLISSRRAADYGSRLVRSTSRGFIYKPDLSGACLEEVVGAG